MALPADKYDLILEVLADQGYRPKRVEELVKHNKLRSLKSQNVVDSLTVLTGAGFAAPAQIPSEKVKEQCRALNRHILQRSFLGPDRDFSQHGIRSGLLSKPPMQRQSRRE